MWYFADLLAQIHFDWAVYNRYEKNNAGASGLAHHASEAENHQALTFRHDSNGVDQKNNDNDHDCAENTKNNLCHLLLLSLHWDYHELSFSTMRTKPSRPITRTVLPRGIKSLLRADHNSPAT